MIDQVSPTRFFSVINASSCGATADGITDDRAALQLAIASALSLRVHVRLGPGTYRIKKYLDVNGARSLKIFGDGATILYPSDSSQVTKELPEVPLDAMARSAILLRHCTDVSIEGITFVGGSGQNLSINSGGAIYATRCVGTRVTNCTMIEGNSPFHQDAQRDTFGSRGALTVSAGVVTLTDDSKQFVAGHVGQRITITGCAQPSNDGSFRIVSYVKADTITYSNPNAVDQTMTVHWSIADADRDTRIEACRIETRGPMTVGPDSVIEACHFERPTAGNDSTGIGDTISVAGSTVTLTDLSGRFRPQHHGRYITIVSTHPGPHDGAHKLTYVSPTQVSWANGGGGSQPFVGTWWIMGGDMSGLGAGPGALVRSGTTVTLTADTASFSPTDTGKVIRIAGATTKEHNGSFVLSFVSPTQVSWTNLATFPMAAPLVEAFSKNWAVDAYDFGKRDGESYGSTHGIYLFAGRDNVLIQGCTFKGIRTTAIKVSGSEHPVRNVTATSNYAEECGAFFVGGADDNQEHTGLIVHNNQVVDCATGRDGWSEGSAITILGSRGSAVTMNMFHYTRNAIGSVDGRGVGGSSAITASRYHEGRTQPVEDMTIVGNKLTADSSSTTPAAILSTSIDLHAIGQRAKYGSAGMLTKLNGTVTLTMPDEQFSKQDIGKLLTLVNSADGNDGTFPIESVPTAKTLTYANSGGASTFNAPVSAGTYRMPPHSHAGERGGACLVADNQVLNVGATGISSRYCVGTEVRGNVFSGLQWNIVCDGDVSPRVVDNREIWSEFAIPRLALRLGVSWPFVDDNLITNQVIGSTGSRGWGVAVIGSIPVDYPLLGKRGRARPTDGREEVVLAYGSLLVDGDTVVVDSTTFTYKTVPDINLLQFGDVAHLATLIQNHTDSFCTDYGLGLRDSAGNVASVSTGHLLIRRRAATASSDNTPAGLKVQVSTLNPTALVLLRNHAGVGTPCDGRGSGTAGSTGVIPDKTVIWSPACSTEGGVLLWADSASTQTLLQAAGYRSLKNPDGVDSGCCELLTHGETTGNGTEQFRWTLT